ncbi:MAG: nuclear transport factor 2 family protein [Alphaproteobacteria bacterium]
MTDPAAVVVKRQFDAYNAHDLDAYMACFAPGIEMFAFGESKPFLSGHDAVRAFYGAKRFNIPALRAELHNEIVLGDTVVYLESLIDLEPGRRQTAIAIHKVEKGLIARMWFIRG